MQNGRLDMGTVGGEKNVRTVAGSVGLALPCLAAAAARPTQAGGKVVVTHPQRMRMAA